MMLLCIILNLLIISVKSDSINIPQVNEEIDDAFLPENIRITRHPKLHQIYDPPHFDYKRMIQQDPQKIRYSQQQQTDSYMRAYQQEHVNKRSQKHRNIEKNPSTSQPDYLSKTTYDTRPKSENRQTSPKQVNVNRIPAEAITDHSPKKVVPTQSYKVDNSPQESFNSKAKAVALSQEKAHSKQKLGYQVSEDISDQETEPSSKTESRVYFGKEEIVKTLQNDPTILSPNYLAKPTYILANPQLNLDPQVLAQGLGYTLPPNHQLSYAGFEPASKADIEALNSLLGKPPKAQLQGLSDLLTHQQEYAIATPAIPIPATQQIILKEFPIEPQALVSVQDHTPIKEEVVEVAKPIVQPAVSQTQINIKTTKVNHQLKVSEESKSIYGDYDDNLQYAAQYAFGYKIRDFHSGNNFGHEEVREGDVAKGHYHVLLPDGRLQNVEYWADPSGYHATVTYSNVARH